MGYLNGLQKILNNYTQVFDAKPSNDEGGDFAKRIQARHQLFWGASDAEIIRNTAMSAEDPLEKWRKGFNWQRKLSNKSNAKEFAKKHGCRVTGLYWKGRDLTTLNFDVLPEHYVIRPTIGHSCNLVFLMKNGLNLMDKRYYSNKELLTILEEAIATNTYQEFLVEEFVRTEQGEYRIPKDYKVYTFNGTIARIEVINRLSPSKGSTSLYTENWEQVENLSTKYTQAPYEEPPACIEEIKSYARMLSKAYEIFVRIDFYATDKGAVFGEFTPTPGLGKIFSTGAEEIFVKYWDEHCTSMI